MPKRKMVQCATNVDKDAVRRESINGVEHVVVSSYTLPDNVVMNGGLYPAEEIAASYQLLERTLAPVEHPTDSNGNYISASDPEAIHNFHAGAFNMNVSRDNGRVHVEKYINVQEAYKTDRGKRLMDRISELETNESPRPIHTSTGVFLEIDELSEPQTNAQGDEYTWIARNMIFDHDAILLDSVGAAQPSQGVGMAVNLKGEEIEVETATIVNKEAQQSTANDMRTNAEGVSLFGLVEMLTAQLPQIITADYYCVVDIYDDVVVFETNIGFYEVPYRIDNESATIVGIPVRVERNVTYSPKTNSDEGEAMKDLILEALKANGIDAEGMSDDALLDAYKTTLEANNSDSDSGASDNEGDIATVVANAIQEAVQPVAEELAGLKAKIALNAEEEKEALIEVIVNSALYPDFDKEDARLFSVDKLKSMSANCGSAHGIPTNFNANSEDGFTSPAEMPE